MDKKQANIEAAKIIAAHNKRADEIMKEAKKNGTWLMGLDANKGLFKALEEETNQKLKLLASMVEK